MGNGVYPGGGSNGRGLVTGDIKDGVFGVCVVGGGRSGSLGTGYGAVVGVIEGYGYGSRCGGCVIGLVNGDGSGDDGPGVGRV